MRRLNHLPQVEAEAGLRACCGATVWVRRMLSQRPFKDADEVRSASERIMDELTREDWLEAFAAHPRIGEQAGGAWAAEEQRGMESAGDPVKAAMAEVNRAYQSRFGHIYIVCATGRSAREMLDLATARLANDPDTELSVAAGEQRAITRLRIEKLLAI